jgi:hypothetical protein
MLADLWGVICLNVQATDELRLREVEPAYHGREEGGHNLI